MVFCRGMPLGLGLSTFVEPRLDLGREGGFGWQPRMVSIACSPGFVGCATLYVSKEGTKV